MTNKPAKPLSPTRKALRAAQLGVALGVGVYILSTIATFEIVSGLLGLVEPSDSIWRWITMRIGVEQLGPLAFAPLIGYGAGKITEGSRWAISVAMVLTVQVTVLLVRSVSVGFEEFFTAEEAGLWIGATVAGTLLSGWVMGKAREPKPVAVAAATPARPRLAEIDSERVKQELPAEAPAAPAPEAKLEAPPSPGPQPQAAEAAPAASEPKVEPKT